MPTQRNTIRLSDTARGIRAAASILGDGGLIAFPTETVYGLGADARQDRAVGSIYEAKARPGFNPLIVHVANLDMAQSLAVMSETAILLAQKFWPGPLTLVLPMRENSGIAEKVSAGLPTLAIRVPAHPTAQKLLKEFQGPIAAPSANRSGKISPTNADHVLDGLSGRIDAVIDAGDCPVGLESTIIGFEPDPVMLRPGGISIERISEITTVSGSSSGKISAPGQLASHYAPETLLVLNARDQADKGNLWIAFGPLNGRKGISLSRSSDLSEAASNLFATMRAVDEMAREIGHNTVYVDPIPDTGLGRAINDRLSRAAAPRHQL